MTNSANGSKAAVFAGVTEPEATTKPVTVDSAAVAPVVEEAASESTTTAASTAASTAANATTPTEAPVPAPAITPLFKPAVVSDAPKAEAKVSGDSVPATDEDCSKDYAPVVHLSEVKTKTGEEDEEVRFKIRAKLFRFDRDLKEWKERGTGDVRVLKHKGNKKIRLLMRREKTLKICLNHYVNPEVELGENFGSDRSWVWHGVDWADGERDLAMLAIRFRDSDNANLFKTAYDEAREDMRLLKEGVSVDDTTGEDAADKADAE